MQWKKTRTQNREFGCFAQLEVKFPGDPPSNGSSSHTLGAHQMGPRPSTMVFWSVPCFSAIWTWRNRQPLNATHSNIINLRKIGILSISQLPEGEALKSRKSMKINGSSLISGDAKGSPWSLMHKTICYTRLMPKSDFAESSQIWSESVSTIQLEGWTFQVFGARLVLD